MSYMILFEAEPAPGREAEYFELSKGLFELLPGQPGFIRIDRARSVLTDGKLLSISFWESEAAIEGWKANPLHRKAQEAGRRGIFKSMRITRLKVLSERDVPTVT